MNGKCSYTFSSSSFIYEDLSNSSLYVTCGVNWKVKYMYRQEVEYLCKKSREKIGSYMTIYSESCLQLGKSFQNPKRSFALI